MADSDLLLNESKVFCMAPWVHLHFNPHGQVFPCCISAHYLEGALGDLSKGESLQEIWNSENTRQLRKNMLDGKPSKLCDLCYRYERIGDKSPREDMNELFGKYIGLTDKTKPDGKYDDYTIKFVDFRFSNICNYKCRICSQHFSSKWYEDAKAIGWVEDWNDHGRLVVPVHDFDALWSQVEPLLAGIEKIQFAGGEPLVMKEHYMILDYFLEHGMYDVNITYNTNFSTFKYKETDVVDRWKKFTSVSLAASLDGMGDRGDYMRKGQRWKDVEENRMRMLKECPHVNFQLTPTVSIMNVLHIPDFYRDWVEKKFIQPHQMNIYLLFEPEWYNIQRLPVHFKKMVAEKYFRFRDEFLKTLPNYESIWGQFKHILDYMNEQDLEMTAYFKEFNQKLDDLRSENFSEVFPELSELMQ